MGYLIILLLDRLLNFDPVGDVRVEDDINYRLDLNVRSYGPDFGEINILYLVNKYF